MKHRRGALRCQSRSSLLHEISVCSHHLQLPAHSGTRTSSDSAVVSCWLSHTSLGRAQSGQSPVYQVTDLLGATIATGGQQLGILLCYSFTAPQDAAASVATFTRLQCLPLPQCILQGGPLIAINEWWVSTKFHTQWARTKHEICLVVYVAETANFSKVRRQIVPLVAVTMKSNSETKAKSPQLCHLVCKKRYSTFNKILNLMYL